LLVLLFTINASAREVGLHFDELGRVIPPDEYILFQALQADKDGYTETAMKEYIRAAEFGNKHAKYLLSMSYLKKKDWANAYAWLRISDPKFKDTKIMLNNVKSLILPDELLHSDQIFKDLEIRYSDIAALERREKWTKSLSFTGSHIKGRVPPFLKIATNNGRTILGASLRKRLNRFVFEYEEIETNIQMGEIITVDTKK